MSLAPEFPPVVHIPARARRRAGALALVGSDAPRPLFGDLEAGWSESAAESAAVFDEPFGVVAFDSPRPLRLVRSPRLEPVALEAAPVALAPVSRPALRLTARGRLALALLAGVIAVVLLFVAHASRPASAASAAPTVPATVTVHNGDTLWSIAGQVAPGRDPRAVVDQLVRINHLSGVGLYPGQVLHTR